MGITIGERGGIVVNKHMQTNLEDVYAVGDCVETTNLITNTQVHAPFGDLANLQGRVAGENAICGNVKEFPGTIQTGICKVFDYGVGSTGLSEQNAARNKITNYEVIYNASLDRPGFMQGKLLVTKLLADKSSRRILGAQVLGPGDVGKQIAIWAMAIQNHMTVDQM